MQAQNVGVTHVTDGDTFKTSDGETVRIMGIDAPENDEGSTNYLSNMILGKAVTLRADTEDRDKYGRRLAIVELADGTDVAGKMIEDGWAMVYLKYPCSRNDIYLELEIEARRAGRGMWAGHFQSTVTSGVVPLLSSTQNSVTANTQPTGVTVYVTKTGAKYHSGGCSSLSKSKIPMPLNDAASRYGPCARCNPPTVAQGTTYMAPPVNTAPPVMNYSAPSVSSGRCAATTKKGSQCKRNAAAGSAYCWQHGG